MNGIKFIRVYNTVNECIELVNVSHIICIRKTKDSGLITLTDEGYIYTKETRDKILKLINED